MDELERLCDTAGLVVVGIVDPVESLHLHIRNTGFEIKQAVNIRRCKIQAHLRLLGQESWMKSRS